MLCGVLGAGVNLLKSDGMTTTSAGDVRARRACSYGILRS